MDLYVPMLQIKNSEVIVYKEWRGPRTYHNQDNPFSDRAAYSGSVTDGSVKRLKKCISLLVQKSPRISIYNPVAKCHHPFRLSFITLTIADQKRDTAKDVYKNCMAKWLRWARRAGMTDYVWKAELQQRGALHYHLSTNMFMHWEEVRDVWNKYQRKAGYLDKYAKQNGHFKANSTDVHSIRKVKDIERYLSKYMQKGIGNSSINGKVWDASKNLKQSKLFSTEMTPKNLQLIRSIAKKKIESDHCTIFQIPQDSATAVLDNIQKAEYSQFLKSLN